MKTQRIHPHIIGFVEWEFPGFSVEACRDRLYAAQAMLERDGVLQGTTHRYLLIARKAEP